MGQRYFASISSSILPEIYWRVTENSQESRSIRSIDYGKQSELFIVSGNMACTALSDFERSYISQGIKEDVRADGRSRQDYRHFKLRTGIVSNTSGSAEIKLVGGANYK